MGKFNSHRDNHGQSLHYFPIVSIILFTSALLIVVSLSSLKRFQISQQMGEMTVLFLLILVTGFLFLAILWIFQRKVSKLEQKLVLANNKVFVTNRMLEALFKINQKIHVANDENEVIQHITHELIELTGARAVTFVPLDEYGQPQAEISEGVLLNSELQYWLDLLRSEEVRQKCSQCKSMELIDKLDNCPIISNEIFSADLIFCFPIQRSDRLYGIFNLCIEKPFFLDKQRKELITTLLREAAIGLESLQIRRREISALRQIQTLKQKSDITNVFQGLLENVYEALEADFALLHVDNKNIHIPQLNLALGDDKLLESDKVEEIIRSVMNLREPLFIENSLQIRDQTTEGLSILAAPITDSEDNLLGVIALVYQQGSKLQRKQLSVLQTIAGQISVVVKNANLISELEYKTLIQERTRLAREIHDGLAQTLGYLKLQTVQIRNFLNKNEFEKAQTNVDLCYQTITDAYTDTRQVIDGLRISPDTSGLEGWIETVVKEFKEISGLEVDLYYSSGDIHLPLEIQAQLIRIFQEALSNVHKHSSATSVTISIYVERGDFVMEIRDNGCGFSPEEISITSRHGLRGMKERADLIEADFQIISRPQNGTAIIVRSSTRDVEKKKVL